jgi:hypothetical protein
VEFGGFLVAATLLNCTGQPDWTLTVDDWLANVPLSDSFKQNVIKNFLYQFVSLPYVSIGNASAVYATTYFVRNVFGGTATAALDLNIPTFQTNQSLIGLLGILEQALEASGVSAQTGSPVTAVAPGANGVAVTVSGNDTINAQYVVMACDPGASATLLTNGGTARSESNRHPAGTGRPVSGSFHCHAAERQLLDAGRSNLLGGGEHPCEYSSTKRCFQRVVWAPAAALWEQPADPRLQVVGLAEPAIGRLQLGVLHSYT